MLSLQGVQARSELLFFRLRFLLGLNIAIVTPKQIDLSWLACSVQGNFSFSVLFSANRLEAQPQSLSQTLASGIYLLQLVTRSSSGYFILQDFRLPSGPSLVCSCLSQVPPQRVSSSTLLPKPGRRTNPSRLHLQVCTHYNCNEKVLWIHLGSFLPLVTLNT